MSQIDWTGEATAAVVVSDFEQGVAWYRDVLGFEVVFELPAWPWAELRSPVSGLRIGVSQADDVKQGGGATLVFKVKDVDAARASLESKGVAFDGETIQIEDMVRLATFSDPDGNVLTLEQALS
jgi:predicted enzyme related to lactoylglutathione lyase